MDEIQDKNITDRLLTAAILLSVEVESNFKLYSYRVVDPQNFMVRTRELIEVFLKEVKTIKEQPVVKDETD